MYISYGNKFTPFVLRNQDLSFLGPVPATIISDVTEYIVVNNIDINTEEGIRSLTNVQGIGPWTIDTTLLTTLKNWAN